MSNESMCTGVIQMIVCKLSHILLSSEYSGFRPSSTDVRNL